MTIIRLGRHIYSVRDADGYFPLTDNAHAYGEHDLMSSDFRDGSRV